MIQAEMPYPHRQQLLVAGLLSFLGLITALIYVLRSTPYTMILFLMAGQALFAAGIVLFVYVVVRDIRARLGSVAGKRFVEGEIICRQGDPAEFTYVINSGEVEFVREDADGGESVLGRLGPDEHFGELAILGNLPYQATARAVSEAEVLVIHRTDFDTLYRYLPKMRKRIEADGVRRREQLKDILRPDQSGDDSE